MTTITKVNAAECFRISGIRISTLISYQYELEEKQVKQFLKILKDRHCISQKQENRLMQLYYDFGPTNFLRFLRDFSNLEIKIPTTKVLIKTLLEVV